MFFASVSPQSAVRSGMVRSRSRLGLRCACRRKLPTTAHHSPHPPAVSARTRVTLPQIIAAMDPRAPAHSSPTRAAACPTQPQPPHTHCPAFSVSERTSDGHEGGVCQGRAHQRAHCRQDDDQTGGGHDGVKHPFTGGSGRRGGEPGAAASRVLRRGRVGSVGRVPTCQGRVHRGM